MHFLNPAGWFALLLSVPIILLYMLRLRRRDVVVPSLLLWDEILGDRHANRPWQKLRRNWMLVLQLLILLAMTLALARPAIPAPRVVHGKVLVLLDVSASMQARHTGGDTRAAWAKRAIRELAATMEGEDRVSLIAVDAEPRLLLPEGDAHALRRTLESISTGYGAANWRAAAALATGLASGDDITTLIVTDAALDEKLPALPGAVRLISVGESVPNVGIVAFSLRRNESGWVAFVRLFNAGPQVSRSVTLYADGALVEQREVLLPTDGDFTLSFDSVPVTAWAEVRLTPQDDFSVDDSAWVAVPPHGDGDVLLVTRGNRFLEQALRSLPGLTFTMGHNPATVSQEGVLVVDGPLTATLPVVNAWLIAPNAGTVCGAPEAVITPTGAVRGLWESPLLRYVDWSQVHVSRARHYIPSADSDILLESASGPLLWTVERPGQRVVCLAFDLHDSDLPLRLAFPILTANVMGWLMPATSTEPMIPIASGAPWIVPLPSEATAATLLWPEGEKQKLTPGTAPRGPDAPGLYRLMVETSGGTLEQFFAVSLLDVAESDLRPRHVVVAGKTVPALSEQPPGWRELSRIVAIGILGLLLLEAVLWWGPEWRQGGALRPRQMTIASFLRLILGLAVLGAIVGMRFTRTTRDLNVVFLVDRSASTQQAWEAQRDFIASALQSKSPRDRAGIVVFGAEARVDRLLSPADTMLPLATLPRRDATNLEEAVRLGLALLPGGGAGRLVLLSDGLETVGHAVWALREAASRGVDVQIVQSGSGSPGPEVWLADLQYPTRVYPGDRVPVTVHVAANTTDELSLTWEAAGQVGQTTSTVRNGGQKQRFAFEAQEAGFTSVQVCVFPQADTFVQNNCSTGLVFVEGSPHVLVVGAPSDTEPLVRALRQNGLAVKTMSPESLPLTVRGLADNAALVLVNTPASAIAPPAMTAIQKFVRDLGGGLVAVGGPQSYGMGGWLGTPLEATLPVEMRLQDPRRFPPLMMVVVIDKSGSMGMTEGGVPKIRLAAEAAVRVAEMLNDSDSLAVVAYDDRPSEVYPLTQMTKRDDLVARLLRMQAGGGGIYVYDSLKFAADMLAQAAPPEGTMRHILLLADGADAERHEGTMPLVARLAAEGVTVSVVAIGAGQDVPFLQQVASAGQGRFYLTQQAAALPAIFAEETANAKRSYIVERNFYPQPVSTWSPVDAIHQTPLLKGYVAAAPKNAAQVVWEATDGDPLLAVWQYGLGEAVAWTSDATGRWAASWASWADFSRFWGGVVRHVFPPPSGHYVTLHVHSQGRKAQVVVDAVSPGGEYANGLRLYLRVSPTEVEASQTISLSQVAPGRYVASFVSPERGAVLLKLYGERQLLTGWTVPPSRETLPGDAVAALTKLQAQGTGRKIAQAEQVFTHDLQGREAGRSLAPWLLLGATLLWPVDIAVRRLAIRREEIQTAWRKLKVKGDTHKTVPAASTAPSTLAAVVRRKHKLASPRRWQKPPGERVTSSSSQAASSPSLRSPSSSAPLASASEDVPLASRLKRRIRGE